jgi:hypothetical protein
VISTVPTANAAGHIHALFEEEEILTGYDTSRRQTGDWQYKIMRGDYSTQEKLEQMLDEQSEYGWILLEVFDIRRVRLMRPASEVSKDPDRDGNPYQTHKPIKLAGCAVNALILLGIGSGLMLSAMMLVISAAP